MEDKEYEKQYAAGYNNGYLLSRFEPMLFKDVLKRPDSEDPFSIGVKDGGLKHEHDLVLENIQKSRAMTKQNKPKMR